MANPRHQLIYHQYPIILIRSLLRRILICNGPTCHGVEGKRWALVRTLVVEVRTGSDEPAEQGRETM